MELLQVADPFRWLEDPDAEETQKFVEELNKVSRPFLDKCELKENINKRFGPLWFVD